MKHTVYATFKYQTVYKKQRERSIYYRQLFTISKSYLKVVT